jgi:AAA domain, putative AbiEii toxin, Type IV TA system
MPFVLHRLEIANFYSIREPQVIDLVAAQNAPDVPGRLAPVWPGATERAPKVVAVFGANAAGKSNVLKALAFLAVFVRDSFQFRPGDGLLYARFNDEEMLSKPTRLALHASGAADGSPDPVIKSDMRHCRYTYELSLGGPPTEPQRVLHEALYYWPGRARRFERDAEGRVRAGKDFGLSDGYRKPLDTILRPNASVISTLAQIRHPLSELLRESTTRAYGNIFVQTEAINEVAVARDYATTQGLLERLNCHLERLDLGIKAMHLQQTINGPITQFEHRGLAGLSPAVMESHGTRQFVAMFPIIERTLANAGVAIIDELDQSIHPLVLPEIIRWFHDPERNPNDAQLWMTCQNASLLEELTKEEIIFCDKDERGRTSVYRLADVPAVRRDDNYYRKYLGGVYGAVPHLG